MAEEFLLRTAPEVPPHSDGLREIDLGVLRLAMDRIVRLGIPVSASAIKFNYDDIVFAGGLDADLAATPEPPDSGDAAALSPEMARAIRNVQRGIAKKQARRAAALAEAREEGPTDG